MISPSVSTVICTRDRPEMVREAIRAVLTQEYDGDVEVVVVFDRSHPDPTLELREPGRTVRVVENHRSAGLPGARNSGIEQASHEIIAFCDDDDLWHPHKLRHQVPALLCSGSPLVTTGISVDYEGTRSTRVLSANLVTLADLLVDRHTELHPSTFLSTREALHRLGLVNEQVPGGFGEDYDLLLRAAREQPLRHVRLPLTTVRWSGNSYFFRRWDTMAEGLSWLLEQYPEFESQPRGAARIRGQIAFAHAAAGRRRTALRWAASAWRRDWKQPRVPLSLAVAAGFPASTVMEGLHRRGRGI